MPVPTAFSRTAGATVPGYDAMHDLGGCLLRVLLKRQARILVVGAGTGQEVFSLGRHGKKWSFTAVEPSYDLIQKARGRMLVEGIDGNKVEIHRSIDDVVANKPFDAASMILMLHRLDARPTQLRLLEQTAKRLKRDAPMLVALPCTDHDEDDLFVKAWQRRLRSQGMTLDDINRHLAIQLTSSSISDDEQVLGLLKSAGFVRPRRYFSSLFFSAWLVRRG
jgi:tRNA (cmo5U34)-methyltransferase